MRFENLLTRSFAIVRHKPWLWLLALLAGETSSGGGGSGGGGNFNIQPSRGSTGFTTPDFTWVPHWLADRSGVLLEIGAVLLVVGLAWFLVSCIASGALVAAVARLDGGEPMTLGTAWRIGTASFRRVLLFKLLLLLLLVAPVLLLAVIPLLGSLGGGSGLLIGLLLDAPLAIAYFYWAAFLAWLSVIALRVCVLEERGARASLTGAWALLRRRFHRIALTTLVFIAVGFGISILTSVVFGFVEAPFIATVAGLASAGRWTDLLGTVVLWLAILVPVSLAVSSAVGAYFATAWTVAYRRFDVEGQVAEPPPLAV